MVHFYISIIESILTYSIIMWYAATSAKDKRGMQSGICSAEVIGYNLTYLGSVDFQDPKVGS